MTEEDAYMLEIQLIKQLGRKGIDLNGVLTNILIEAKPPVLKGEQNPNYGKPGYWFGKKMNLSADERERRGNQIKQYAKSGKENNFYGQSHSTSTKIILSEKRNTINPHGRGMANKNHSQESKALISKHNRSGEDIVREKISKSLKGKSNGPKSREEIERATNLRTQRRNIMLQQLKDEYGYDAKDVLSTIGYKRPLKEIAQLVQQNIDKKGGIVNDN